MGTESEGFPSEPEPTFDLAPFAEMERLRGRVYELEGLLASAPAVTSAIGVSSLTGGPLTVTPEAAEALAEAGLVVVGRGDLRAVLAASGSAVRFDAPTGEWPEAWDRLCAAAGMAVGAQADLAVVDRGGTEGAGVSGDLRATGEALPS